MSCVSRDDCSDSHNFSFHSNEAETWDFSISADFDFSFIIVLFFACSASSFSCAIVRNNSDSCSFFYSTTAAAFVLTALTLSSKAVVETLNIFLLSSFSLVMLQEPVSRSDHQKYDICILISCGRYGLPLQ